MKIAYLLIFSLASEHDTKVVLCYAGKHDFVTEILHRIFDRDMPSNDKTVFVTLSATDRQYPPMSAFCNLEIRIMDINDNAPVFLQGSGLLRYPAHEVFSLLQKVPYNLPVGAVVANVTAVDKDEGEYGTITYNILPHIKSPSDSKYFRISANAEVTLAKPFMDREVFYIRVSACDLGTPAKCSMLDLKIMANSPMESLTSFLLSPKLVRINEYNYDLKIPVATIEAKTTDAAEYIWFELVRHNDLVSYFTLESVKSNVVNLQLERQLDCEYNNNFTIYIRARKANGPWSTTAILLLVEDINDEKPVFLSKPIAFVYENEPSGTVVTALSAADADRSFPNNNVSFWMESDDKFMLDLSGILRSRMPFDREERDTYYLKVIARDGSPSAIYNNGEPNERSQILKISILDRNDNAPEFLKTIYGASVDEVWTELETNVVEVVAIDKDLDNLLAYSIEEEEGSNIFQIRSSPKGAVIQLNGSVGSTAQDYKLTVVASDSLHKIKCTVVVAVVRAKGSWIWVSVAVCLLAFSIFLTSITYCSYPCYITSY